MGALLICAQPKSGDRGSVVGGAKDRCAGDEDVGASGRRASDRLGSDPAVYLEVYRQVALIDPAPQRLDLREHARDELLASEAGVDGHHEHLVEIGQHQLDGLRWGRRIQHHGGSRAGLPDLRDRAMEVRAGLDVDPHCRGARPDVALERTFRRLDHQVDIEGKLAAATDGLDYGRADREVGNELAVHYIDVYPVGARVFHGADLVAQAGEVASQYRRGDAGTADASHETRSRRAAKKPSVSWRCGRQLM